MTDINQEGIDAANTGHGHVRTELRKRAGITASAIAGITEEKT